MFALLAQLTPLWEIVRSLVQDISLSICTVCSHDVLLDWFFDSDRLDCLIEGWKLRAPFSGRDNFNNA